MAVSTLSQNIQKHLQSEATKWQLKISHVPLTYDPSGLSLPLATLKRFDTVKQNTHCIFAKASRVWGSPDYDRSLSLEANIAATVNAFTKFVYVMSSSYPDISGESLERMMRSEHVPKREWNERGKNEKPGLDGFVIEVRGKEYGESVEAFGETVRRVLTHLCKLDPERLEKVRVRSTKKKKEKKGMGERENERKREEEEEEEVEDEKEFIFPSLCMDCPSSGFSSPAWCFEFSGETFFVTAFAPCFPSNHARYMFANEENRESCFILFQPEVSFLHHNLSPDTPHTNWEDPKTERERIRVAFKEAGREYFIPPTISYPTAHYIVPSLKLGGPIVRWWEKKPKQE